jgi:hypothetical protein
MEASATRRAKALATRLAALPEPAMRRVAMAEWMTHAPPAEQVDLLVVVLRRGREGGPPFHLALAAFTAALGGDAVPYDIRRDLYARAKDRGYEDLAQLFLSAIEMTPAAEGAIGRLLQRDGKPLTLGERKQLARGGRRDLLDRLLRDPDPAVIRLLLGNPRLTESNVITIASRRPTHADIQREVYAARRWIARYHVKRTLVLNPWTPTDLAIRLLPFLTEPDLRLVVDDAELGAAVRTAAEKLTSS